MFKARIHSEYRYILIDIIYSHAMYMGLSGKESGNIYTTHKDTIEKAEFISN